MTAISRRRALTVLALILAAGGCGSADHHARSRSLTIAAGDPGGLYVEFAQLLAKQLTGQEPWLHVQHPEITNGSMDNLHRLAEKKADVALATVDAAQVIADGPGWMRAIGRIYEDYLQLVVLADSPIGSLADLAGHTVSLGAPGSGAELEGVRLLAAAGLPAGAVTVRPHGLAEAITALETGGVDALLWSGGVPTPALTEFSKRRAIRLLPLTEILPALAKMYGSFYQAATVPAAVYGPAAEVSTIGIANLLLCRADTDPATTSAIARVLVIRAADLVPQQVLGTQFLDPYSLIATEGIPLHPGAAEAYRELHG
jgi:uncharacterized protein